MPAPRGHAQDETPGLGRARGGCACETCAARGRNEKKTDHHISSRVGKIQKWRRGHPVRVPNGGPVAEIPVPVKPTPTDQLPWHAYRMQSDPHYEMIVVRFLVDITERAQPLAGCIDKPLKQVTINGRRMEHFHSIDRIAELAMSHPEVAEVQKHNLHNQQYERFDETGRATRYHQSPWDLKLRLAATGATMYVGYTVNGAGAGMANIWMCPGSGLNKKG